jgi:O-antigen ligase
VSIKGLLFIGGFMVCAVGALFLPHLGIYGYIADYCINPNDQWWAAPFSRFGVRYSLTLALATLIGMVLQRNKLQFGRQSFYDQEMLLLFLLGVVWLTVVLGGDTVGRYASTDHPSIKFTKIVIFCLMMTHVVTDIRKLNGLFWVFATISLILGMKAWNVPYSAFVGGRLEGIGGADFAEANFFAAFMAAMLPIIGIQFLRSGWYGKLYGFLCAVFTANAVVLCRSRGAFVGLAAGALVACFFAPKQHRKKIFILMVVGIIGVVYITDSFFIDRILSISTSQAEMDSSSSNRLELWKAGGRIFIDHPLGIGPGNWYQTIGRYVPELEGKDSHNTYVKCAVELGIFGIGLFTLMLYQAYANLRKVYRDIRSLPAAEADLFAQYYFSTIVSLAILLACALTITMIYTEVLWVLLMLPICIRRALDNILLYKD